MSGSERRVNVKKIITLLIGILLAFAIAMVVLGEFIVAGVTLLSLTFAIYLRETWE